MHLSDLHLGKRVNEFSMLEDQQYILQQILSIADAEKPDAVLIAGDIYDKSVPSAEAMELLDDFLNRLADRSLLVFLIYGNHDSPERVAFGHHFMERSGIYISPVYEGKVEPITLRDAFGPIRVWLLPFVKPVTVRHYLEESFGRPVETYTDAMEAAIGQMEIDLHERNILVTHQFAAGAQRSESEEISVGGTDAVNAAIFSDFDYVALGHIHRPQSIGKPQIRYCGTPLKYSFSEASHEKSVTMVEMREKGSVDISTIPLKPYHDMREIRGTYDQLTSRNFYQGTPVDDYMHITLTDETDIPDAIHKLRIIYPNIMKLDYDNTRTRSAARLEPEKEESEGTPIDIFEEFYEKQNGRELDEEQRGWIKSLADKIWGEEL